MPESRPHSGSSLTLLDLRDRSLFAYQEGGFRSYLTDAPELVFDHDADLPPGTHVPAGGVSPEEPPEVAVLREVAEECGPTCVRVLRPIAEEPTRTRSAASRDADVPDAWDHPVTRAGRDNGMTFHCRFAPLPLPQPFPLVDGQDAWLDRLEA